MRRLVACRVLCLALALLAAGPAAAAENYVLGPGDTVRLKVYEWRASLGQVFDWKALNDKFIVSASGTLSLPFAGEISAAGRTPGELGPIIGEQLMRRMGLGRRPDASVEVVTYRPFYVVGTVKQPGEFPYRPGMTALKALSLAGGLQRAEGDFLALERDAIAVSGELDLLVSEADRLEARRARLGSELDNAKKVEFPDHLASRAGGEPAIARLLEQERLIFASRLEGFETQVAALRQLKDHLETELGSLGSQLDIEKKQIMLVEKELEGVNSLADRGLTTSARQLSLERTLAQVQGDRLRAETSLLRARQEIAKTEIAIIELQNQRANEVSMELRETQANLDDVGAKLETAGRILDRADRVAPYLRARHDARSLDPSFTILREIAGETVELNVAETAAVQPGDTIKVDTVSGAQQDAAAVSAVQRPM